MVGRQNTVSCKYLSKAGIEVIHSVRSAPSFGLKSLMEFGLVSK